MINEIKLVLDESMNSVLDTLKKRITKIRTGKASAHVLDNVKVDYYGSPTPVSQVGQISSPEARLLQIQPFDKSLISEIEKAIMGANLGLTPSNDGNLIRIPFPALTEETRKNEVKNLKKMGEESKISMRNSRRDQNEIVKKLEKKKDISEDISKKYLSEIQEITDGHIKKVDEIINLKEKEILTL